MIIKLLNGSVVSHIGYGSYSNIFNRTDLELFMAILKVVFNKKIKVSLKTKKLLYNIARKTYDNLKPEIIKLIMRNAGFPVIPTSYPSSVNADNLLNKLKNLTIPEIESYFMNIKLFDDDKENLKGLKKLEKIIYSNVF
jgi:hypothetical protein